MAETRRYSKYGRPPLPRNKYGSVFDYNLVSSTSTGNPLYGDSTAGSVVGAEMASLSDFAGATEFDNGVRGLVPAPMINDRFSFLQGTGGWTDIPAARWLEEFPVGEGLEKSGLTIDGDFNVGKTLSTMNLKVEGAAHFWSLIIDEVKANGGQVLVSPSMFHVDHVGDIIYYPVFTSDSPLIQIISCRKDIDNTFRAVGVSQIKCRRAWQRNDDGSSKIRNEVEVGDMLRCRNFNIQEGVYHNVGNVDYWTFVCAVGEGTYLDENDNERSGFWIDLAYGLKLENGRNIPLGSVLRTDGTYTIPEDYPADTNVNTLKSVSQETLNGDPDVDNEYVDSEEYVEVENKVIAIRGFNSAIDTLTGERSMDDMSGDDLRQVTQQLEFIANGTLDDNANEDDLSSLILNGTYSDSSTVENDQSTLQQASLRVADIDGGASEIEVNKYYLKTDKVTDSEIVIAEGTVSDREFIAAEDLYDIHGQIQYYEGDTIPTDTTFLDDWRVIDREPSDTVIGVDEVTGDEFVPTNLSEITTQTDETGEGKIRDTDYYMDIDLSDETEFLFGYGKFTIKSGDSLACLGHLYLSERQNAIVLSAQDPVDPELVAPAMAQYKGIYKFGESISKFRMTAIAANGNEFIGSFLVNYNNTYVEINDRIDMFVNDITSGLEKVGIHLDGDNSTITMVGNIELRQHSNNSYDTLSVFDNLNTKRVEITPFDIPKRNSTESSIDISTKSLQYISDTKNATKSYIYYDSWRHWWFWPFNSSMVYVYELRNYNIAFNTSVDLGQINSHSKLDFSNLKIDLWAKTYLCGSVYVSDHGTQKQDISTIQWALRKNGSYIDVNGSRWHELRQNSGISITGLDTDYFTITISSTFLDDYVIPSTANYSVDFMITFNVYCYYKSWDKSYNNYYYKINCGLSGSMKTAVSKSNSEGDDISNRKMTIGTNGLVFQANNSRYFYAGSDGYELKWDDVGIRFDSEVGLQENKLYKVISTGEWINKKYDIIIANYSSSGYSCYLPSVSSYGVGRKLTVLAFQGLKLYTSGNDKVRVCVSNGIYESEVIEFGRQTVNDSITMPKYVVELISINGAWYIVSYF